VPSSCPFFRARDLAEKGPCLAGTQETAVLQGFFGACPCGFFSVNGVKIDCVAYPYKWLAPPVVSDGVRLAAVSDIAAMKIAAVTNRGTRKDFVDVFFLLRFHSLEQLMNWYTQKYPDGNTYLTMRSLVYFADAEQEVMPKMLMPVEWESVKTTIRKAVRELDRKSP